MIRLTPINSTDDLNSKLAEEIAIELCDAGVAEGLALPTAIGILGGIQDAIDSDDLQTAIDHFRHSRKQSDQWWVKYHPKSERAKKARQRLKSDQAL